MRSSPQYCANPHTGASLQLIFSKDDTQAGSYQNMMSVSCNELIAVLARHLAAYLRPAKIMLNRDVAFSFYLIDL
jgi:hypothetical protein